MSDATDADRKRAARIVGSESPWLDMLAAALAEERAPFLTGIEQIREIAREAAKVRGCEEFAARVAMVTKELPR